MSSSPNLASAERAALPSTHPLAAGRRTVLVTGAAGFIASHLCDALLRLGHRVVAVDNFCEYYSPAQKRSNVAAHLGRADYRLVETDLATADLDALLDSVDAVFHLAGQPGVRGSWGSSFTTYLGQNVLVTQRLLEALRHRPVPAVVSSTSSVYGDAGASPVTEDAPPHPVSPYGMTKLAAEQLVGVYRRDQELPVTIVRYFTVFGPRQRPDMAFHRFIAAVESGEPVHVFGTGQQSRDFTFVADAVSATVAALGAPSPVYNVGGGTPATVNEALRLLGELTGRRPEVLYGPVARGDVHATSADTSLARAELGWRPRGTLADGLAAQLDWYRASTESLRPAV